MRTLFTVALLAATVLAAAPASADDPRALTTGTFKGRWCGYDAVYHIESSQVRPRRVLEGHITFRNYPGVSDRIRIQQFPDWSIYMVRYLSPPDAPESQVVQTKPPVFFSDGSAFYGDKITGKDCEGEMKLRNSFLSR